MKPMHLITFLGAALSVAAMAAPANELRVGGTIRPGACLPSLGPGGQVDFGAISAEAFRQRRRVVLEAMQFNFSITCDMRVRVGITPHDNQAHSADHDVSEELAPELQASPDDIFGLGSDSGRNLGGYQARFVPGSFTADGREVDVISQAGDGRWVRRNGGQIRHEVITSWAPKGSLTPGEFGHITGVVRIRAVLNALDDIKQDANLDGSLTLELKYL